MMTILERNCVRNRERQNKGLLSTTRDRISANEGQDSAELSLGESAPSVRTCLFPHRE